MNNLPNPVGYCEFCFKFKKNIALLSEIELHEPLPSGHEHLKFPDVKMNS